MTELLLLLVQLPPPPPSPPPPVLKEGAGGDEREKEEEEGATRPARIRTWTCCGAALIADCRGREGRTEDEEGEEGARTRTQNRADEGARWAPADRPGPGGRAGFAVLHLAYATR